MPRNESVLFPAGRPSQRPAPLGGQRRAAPSAAPSSPSRSVPAPRSDPMDQYIAYRTSQGWGGPPHAGGTKMAKRDGGYAGYSSRTDMLKAIEGDARLRRERDLADAAGWEMEANDRLGQVERSVGQRQAGIDRAMADAAETFREDRNANRTEWNMGLEEFNRRSNASPGHAMGGIAMQEKARPEHADGYVEPYRGSARDLFSGEQSALDAYAEQAVQPYNDRLALVDAVRSTPWSDYGRESAAGFGLDPALAAGLYGTPEDVRGWDLERDAAALDAYGMPYDAWAGEQAAQTKADEAARRDAEQGAKDAQRQALDEASAAEQAAIRNLSDDIFGRTGVDGEELAKRSDMTLEQLSAVLDDPMWSEASAGLGDAIAANDAQTAMAIMDQIATTDPAVYRVVANVFDGMIPSEFDLYTGG